VQTCFFTVEKNAGAFQYDVYAQVFPGKFCRIFDGAANYFLTVDVQVSFVGCYSTFEAAVHGIVFQQVREGVVIGEVVDSHDFNIVIFNMVAKGQTTNTAEAVDSNTFF